MKKKINFEAFVKGNMFLVPVKEEKFKLKKPDSLYDISNPVFEYLYSGNSAMYPCKEFASKEWMSFWKRLGMNSTPSEEEFKNCCFKISREFGNLTHIPDRLVKLLNHIILMISNNKNLYNVVSDIDFFPAKWDERTIQKNIMYRKIKDIEIEIQRNLVWSIVPFFPKDLNITKSFLENCHKMDQFSDISMVFKHLSNFHDGKIVDKSPNFSNSIKEIYSFLNNFSRQELLPYNKDFERLFLVSNYCSPQSFVTASQLKFKCDDLLKPYIYQVPEEIYKKSRNLLTMFQVLEEPSLEDYLNIGFLIYTQNKNTSVDPNQLKTLYFTYQKLLLFIQKDHNLVHNLKNVYLPDTSLLLQPISKLCYLDVTTLEDKVDLKMTNCVHKDFNFIASKLKITGLSSVVIEKYDDSVKQVEQKLPSFFPQLQKIITSKEFREGLKRIYLHESTNTSNKIIKKIDFFSKFTLKCLQSISSCFFDSRNNKNVTKKIQSNKQDCFIDVQTNTIYLSQPPNSYTSLSLVSCIISKKISEYLGCQNINISHIQTILTVSNPTEIDSILNCLGIDQKKKQ
eukprot:TRINITY_DN6598_c0_g1_i1.p1 TRINITY_DN6598_c0_g1~~TRINITY_DN6598_c0_g1_i1.p1  ORF type:complete len:567 (+),score=133.05 TRINITY_DN6598_c0_g1_i1:866-2566(+)